MQQLLTDLMNAWNSHDMAAVLPFYSNAYEGVDVASSSTQSGIEGVSKMLSRYWQAFPDLRFDEDLRIVQDHRAVIVWTARGTHLGSILHIPPTGRPIVTRGVSILTIEHDKIRHAEYIWDVAGILRGIGLLPALPIE